MLIRVIADFYDVFVDSKNAWKMAFKYYSNNKTLLDKLDKDISKVNLANEIGVNYTKIEQKYNEFLLPLNDNISILKAIANNFELDLISLYSKEVILRDIKKFNLDNIFVNIYSKNDVENSNLFLNNFPNYDFIVYFNTTYKNIFRNDRIIYIPIDFDSKLNNYLDVGFAEHAKVKLIYNELSDFYQLTTNKDTKQEVTFLMNIFNKYKNNVSTILDCCCGVGRHSKLLGLNGYSVTGIDICENQISNAKKLNSGPNIKYFLDDILKFSYVQNKYDAAICMWTTYNYLSVDKDLIKFLKNVYEHLNDNGLLILESKNIPDLKEVKVSHRTMQNEYYTVDLFIIKKGSFNIQNSHYFYIIYDKNTHEYKFYKDEEMARFYKIDEIKNLALPYFNICSVYGDFNEEFFDEKNSDRSIIVLQKK